LTVHQPAAGQGGKAENDEGIKDSSGSLFSFGENKAEKGGRIKMITRLQMVYIVDDKIYTDITKARKAEEKYTKKRTRERKKEAKKKAER